MIIDSLKNINFYKNISEDIYQGLIFLNNASENIKLGEYIINNKVKAIVTEYETGLDIEQIYEAHQNVIDIQYPIIGLERVKWSPISEMNIRTPYDIKNDVTFYTKPHKQGSHVDIGNGFFTIMFPQDGHNPQLFIDNPQIIKKITIKIINNNPLPKII